MHRLLLLLAFALACLPTAEAAECTVPMQRRWEDAMREAGQIEHLRVRMSWKEEMTDVGFQCRVARALVELTAAAEEYFPACDPIRAGRGHAAVQLAEEALNKFDVSKCSKPQATAAGTKKRSSP